MKKGIKVLLVGMALMLVLTGCTKKDTPENTVDSFFSAIKKLDSETAKKYVSADAKETIESEVDGYIEAEEDEEIDFSKVEGIDVTKANLKELFSELDYKITNTVITDDTAVVTIDANYADASKLIVATVSGVFGTLMGDAFSGKEEPTAIDSLNLINRMFNSNYNDYEKVTTSKTVDINLVKEDDKWVIAEIEEDLVNVLLFNIVEGINDIFSGSFGFGDFDTSGEIQYGEDVEVVE